MREDDFTRWGVEPGHRIPASADDRYSSPSPWVSVVEAGLSNRFRGLRDDCHPDAPAQGASLSHLGQAVDGVEGADVVRAFLWSRIRYEGPKQRPGSAHRVIPVDLGTDAGGAFGQG